MFSYHQNFINYSDELHRQMEEEGFLRAYKVKILIPANFVNIKERQNGSSSWNW